MNKREANKGGRPTLQKVEKRARKLQIRLTEEEYQAFKQKREFGGYRSVTGMILHKVMSRASLYEDGCLSVVQLNVISQDIKEINAVGRNINQIARKMETMDAGAEKALLYEARKAVELLGKVKQTQEEILQIINTGIEERGFEPMHSTI